MEFVSKIITVHFNRKWKWLTVSTNMYGKTNEKGFIISENKNRTKTIIIKCDRRANNNTMNIQTGE